MMNHESEGVGLEVWKMMVSAVYLFNAATIRGNSMQVSYSSLPHLGNPITCLFVLVLQSNEHGHTHLCHLILQ
jgi:hypothetical protein